MANFTARMLRLAGAGMAYIPGGNADVLALRPFADNPLTSDPVRYARVAAVLEAEPALALGSPTIAWGNAAYRVIDEFADSAYASNIRQPLLLIAAGRDEIVSTPAIEDFAVQLRARSQFWAAFNAFVLGTPVF